MRSDCRPKYKIATNKTFMSKLNSLFDCYFMLITWYAKTDDTDLDDLADDDDD